MPISNPRTIGLYNNPGWRARIRVGKPVHGRRSYRLVGATCNSAPSPSRAFSDGRLVSCRTASPAGRQTPTPYIASRRNERASESICNVEDDGTGEDRRRDDTAEAGQSTLV